MKDKSDLKEKLEDARHQLENFDKNANGAMKQNKILKQKVEE